jgi:hypothetical protein
MKKISGSTLFYKRIFPLIWFGGLTVFGVTGLTRADFRADGWWQYLVAIVFMCVVGFFLMKRIVWDLVDEVMDRGEFLLVRKGSEEERVALSNIMNVNVSTNMNPPRITLRLVKPGKFGTEIAFMPPTRFSLNPFTKHPVAEDLIVRVDQARRGSN